MTFNNSIQGNRSSSKILVVDDEPDITTIFDLALKDNGFEVDSFNDPLGSVV